MILKTSKVFETELVKFQKAVEDDSEVTPRRKPAFGLAETLSDSQTMMKSRVCFCCSMIELSVRRLSCLPSGARPRISPT